jgi:hypothetical protein
LLRCTAGQHHACNQRMRRVQTMAMARSFVMLSSIAMENGSKSTCYIRSCVSYQQNTRDASHNTQWQQTEPPKTLTTDLPTGQQLGFQPRTAYKHSCSSKVHQLLYMLPAMNKPHQLPRRLLMMPGPGQLLRPPAAPLQGCTAQCRAARLVLLVALAAPLSSCRT